MTEFFTNQACFYFTASHLNEVAAKCHMCKEMVRTMFIGKYCVRFGSDIHQFCSNTCLEYYKTKIKVCCYCQKNLEKVNKVTSVSNKVSSLKISTVIEMDLVETNVTLFLDPF